MPKKIKVGSTAWVKKMAKARKAAAKERKKRGGKRGDKATHSPSLLKYSSKKQLEQRIADLETFQRELKEAKQIGLASESDIRELDATPRLIKESRMKLSDELKRELESGRNS